MKKEPFDLLGEASIWRDVRRFGWRMLWVHFRHWCLGPLMRRAPRHVAYDGFVRRYRGTGGVRFFPVIELSGRAITAVPTPLLPAEAALDRLCREAR